MIWDKQEADKQLKMRDGTHGPRVRILRDAAGQPYDIQIELRGSENYTPEQRAYDFRRYFHAHDVSWQESSYVYFFQNRLAQYRREYRSQDNSPRGDSSAAKQAERQRQIRDIVNKCMDHSERLAELERFMNTDKPTLASVDALINALKGYKKKIIHVKNRLGRLVVNDLGQKERDPSIENDLSSQVQEFIDKLETAKKNSPLEIDLRPFFSATASPGTLGGLINNQLKTLAQAGISAIFTNVEEADHTPGTKRFIVAGLVFLIAGGIFTTFFPNTLAVQGLPTMLPSFNQMFLVIGAMALISAIYRYASHNTVQSFDLDPAVIALSDAKDGMEKAQSLWGKRYTNTFTEVPQTMQQATRSFVQETKNRAAQSAEQNPSKPQNEAKRNDPLAGYRSSVGWEDTLKQQKQKEIEARRSEAKSTTWLSLAPYLNGMDDTRGLDQILSHFTDRYPTEHNEKGIRKKEPGWLKNFKKVAYGFAVLLVVPAIALELVACIVRVAVSLVTFPLELLFYPLKALGHAILPNYIDAPDNQKAHKNSWIAKIESFFERTLNGRYSPLRTLKRYFQGLYVRTDNAEQDPAYKEVLDVARTHTKSAFHDAISVYGSGYSWAHKFWNGIASVFKKIFTVVPTIAYLVTQKDEHVITTVKQRVDEEYRQYQDALIKKVADSMRVAYEKFKEHYRAQPEKENAVDEQVRKAFNEALNQKLNGDYVLPGVEKWQANTMTLPLDFFDDIAVGLSDLLVNTMFRHSPGAATVNFMAANLSLATLVMPSLVAAGGHGTTNMNIFQYLPKQIAENFCGVNPLDPKEGGIFSQTIAVFMQWKFATLLAEVAKGAYHGELHFFRDLLKEPEKITLGLLFLVASGYGLRYLPAVPTQVATLGIDPASPLATVTLAGRDIRMSFIEFIAMFSEEAGHAGHATKGANTLEEAFLGLKFWLLMQLSFEVHGSHLHPELTLQALKENLQGKDLRNKTPEQRKVVIGEILEKMHLPEAGREKLVTVLETLIDAPLDYLTPVKQQLETQLKAPAAAITAGSKIAAAAPEAKGAVPAVTTPVPVPSSLDKIKQQIKDALESLQKMQAMGKGFGGRTKIEAWQFYDVLDKLFDQYNAEMTERGRPDLWIDKEEFQRSFYNKYYRQDVPGLLLVLFYPFVLVARLFASVTADVFDVRWLKHSVQKANQRDLAAFVYQPLAFVSRVLRAFTKALNYAWVRVLFMVGVSPVLVAPGGREYFMEKAREINPHRYSGAANKFGFEYAQAARAAGVFDADLGLLTGKLLQKVQSDAPAERVGLPADSPAPLGDVRGSSDVAVSEAAVSEAAVSEAAVSEAAVSEAKETNYHNILKSFTQKAEAKRDQAQKYAVGSKAILSVGICVTFGSAIAFSFGAHAQHFSPMKIYNISFTHLPSFTPGDAMKMKNLTSGGFATYLAVAFALFVIGVILWKVHKAKHSKAEQDILFARRVAAFLHQGHIPLEDGGQALDMRQLQKPLSRDEQIAFLNKLAANAGAKGEEPEAGSLDSDSSSEGRHSSPSVSVSSAASSTSSSSS